MSPAGDNDELQSAIVRMAGVRMLFGSVVANENVNFDLRRGEIHALLGENGAGKTTLMRVLAGLLMPQAGAIFVDGVRARITSPLVAAEMGIGMVHQHFMLIPTMTVAENVALGLNSLRGWFPDLGRVAAQIRRLGQDFGLEVDPGLRVGDLSVAGQQRVEILKQLYRGARILVLDEPTAVLSPQEADGLFGVLKSLAAKGTSIVFISHKLREVMALTDRITVLRAGRVVGRLDTRSTSQQEIARLMIGDTLALDELAVGQGAGGPVLLEARGLSVRDRRGITRLDDVSLALNSGEILGVAGVDGSGQQELAETLVGLAASDTGEVRMSGRDITRLSVAGRLRAGMAHIPEDRHRTAIFEAMSIAENVVVDQIASSPNSRAGFLNISGMRHEAEMVVAGYDVRCTGIDQPIGMLSGGNQQKVVLGRALARDPKVIIAVQPTRGLDIGATRFLHRKLLQRRSMGAGILLISMELEELQALSDRIIVMFKGGIVGSLSRAEVTAERLGLMMAGVHQ